VPGWASTAPAVAELKETVCIDLGDCTASGCCRSIIIASVAGGWSKTEYCISVPWVFKAGSAVVAASMAWAGVAVVGTSVAWVDGTVAIALAFLVF